MAASVVTKRVVLADDDPGVRRVISRTLERYPQIEVESFETALDALISVRKRPADLMIIDLGLPVIDGLEIGRLVRSETSRTRILVISGALPGEEDRRNAGGWVDWWLAKPFSQDSLLGIIEQIL